MKGINCGIELKKKKPNWQNSPACGIFQKVSAPSRINGCCKLVPISLDNIFLNNYFGKWIFPFSLLCLSFGRRCSVFFYFDLFVCSFRRLWSGHVVVDRFKFELLSCPVLCHPSCDWLQQLLSQFSFFFSFFLSYCCKWIELLTQYSIGWEVSASRSENKEWSTKMKWRTIWFLVK